MKNLVFSFMFLLATLGFASCQTNEPVNGNLDSRLVGLWAFAFEEGEKTTSFQYVEIHQDGTFEMLTPYTDDVTYYECYFGQCTVRNGSLTFWAKENRTYFYYKNVLRIASIRKDLYLEQLWTVTGISEDKILVHGRKACSMNRLTEKPSIWAPEFFEQERELTNLALVEQWDLLNKTNLGETEFTWFAYNTPQYYGMQLTEDHHVNYAFFWSTWVLDHVFPSGSLPQGKGLRTKTANCTWALRSHVLDLQCSSYDIVSYDADGNETDSQEVIPAQPIEELFEIILFTDHFMVLYSPTDDTHYVFTPSNNPLSAPQLSTPPAHSLTHPSSDQGFQGKRSNVIY